MRAIDDLLLGKDLTVSNSERLFRQFFNLESGLVQKQILVLLQKKGEHPNELAGLVTAVRKIENHRFKLKLPDLTDGCGTGGDGKGTFNISTLACLVAAGAGAHIAKHGNRSITSQCGSADLLESLGVKIDAPPKRMLRALKKCGIGYFHAPLYHPSFRRIQPLRMQLAKKRIKTIFNLAGPLLNPLEPKRQMIGVYRKDFVFVIAEALQKLKVKHALVFWNIGGFDELTTTHKVLMIELRHGALRQKLFSPFSIGFKRGEGTDLNGGSAQRNRQITLRLLSSNRQNSKLDSVVLNAGALLYVSGHAKSIQEGIQRARTSIESKAALQTLKQLARISHDPK